MNAEGKPYAGNPHVRFGEGPLARASCTAGWGLLNRLGGSLSRVGQFTGQVAGNFIPLFSDGALAKLSIVDTDNCKEATARCQSPMRRATQAPVIVGCRFAVRRERAAHALHL